MSLYHNSSGTVSLSNLTTYINSAPSLRDYTGYFHADDNKLNRVWYASAWTDQLCTIPSDQGNSLADPGAKSTSEPTYWWANSTLTNGSYALVDGAKRDKLIWPGDLGIEIPAVFLSTNEADIIKISVQQLFAQQNAATGQMPYAAAPIIMKPADNEISNLAEEFSFTLGYVDGSGLAYIPVNNRDWLRSDMGYYNIEANSMLAYTLKAALALAEAVSDYSESANWTTTINGIEMAANELLWNSAEGLYQDNENNTSLFPQDGNVWAIISGVANSTQAATISNNLRARWGPYGAPAPEAPNTISPFISSYELQAHFLAGQPQNAIDLMRFMGADFMLNDPRMTNSTFIEGYRTDGGLDYRAYSDAARSPGPLLVLSSYVAGLQVLNSTNWIAYPRPGNLSDVEAGFELDYGRYAASLKVDSSRKSSLSYYVSTPKGTTGSIILDIPEYKAKIRIVSTTGYEWSETVDAWTGGANPRDVSFWGPQDSTAGTVEVDGLVGGEY
ncbi:uncharacterized protein N7496_012059 [Penicillium cataractarum]|uniref:Alpha,alpha-trehalase n=1 Tax=Penicillium cataractarum TaxID=2100454 RepID=A0A9W9RGD5_9EURO|nr:uncharacterized protein N7496_012059 [Penicillium cataractarum]KAJ5359646.1 hypothetical protein N7496_012059 [Penicillium cataractarum]